MSVEFFLDTNILVYTFDQTAPTKQNRARQIVQTGLDGSACISSQVVQEFCNVALGRFEPPIDATSLREYQDTVLFPLCRVWPDERLFRDALLVHVDTGYQWYDSLIVAAAIRSGARVLYSEDLQHGRDYRGVSVVNPFRL